MSVKRVVPDFASQSLENAKQFYGRVLGLEPVMDHGWIVTLADPSRPAAQISLMTHDASAPLIPGVSIEVDDVDAVHAAAVREGAEIVHPLTDEHWGVRRFFFETLTETSSTFSAITDGDRRSFNQMAVGSLH